MYLGPVAALSLSQSRTLAIGLMNAYKRLAIGFRNPPKTAT
jgi:hypothetical protein